MWRLVKVVTFFLCSNITEENDAFPGIPTAKVILFGDISKPFFNFNFSLTLV